MKVNYVIQRYNYYLDTWEEVYHSTSSKLANVKLRQLRSTFHYHFYRLYEEVIIVE